ncbi:hypothetical protein DCE79_07945 [Lysinibacillus sp. 2017]|uniref:DUF6944 family repetitive protein n=1 Tax=unclassified Lysinibacillus TaxID=2636778 RepID=UPI000D5258F1|nr:MULTISPECIES: hypothetical protein [unclassified Lysinibacillus]AWE07310.1 hypothetical protein DCE79_07945 [Lysinibacillus sp. 2017]TGN32064.1 hypothetical protein E4L99_16105 [Lysinibacillus sp. S2017]
MTDFNSSNNSRKQNNPFNKWDNLVFPKRRENQNSSSNNNESDSNITAIAGNWIEAIGTIITAIGSTPSTIFTQQTLTDFNIIGNILEAGGTAIAAESEDSLLNSVGDQLQAIGNLAVVAGILGNNEQSSQLLEMQGNLLQVVGIGVTINTQGQQTLLQTISNTGNIIQLIGTVIQVFANTDTQEGIEMNAIGAWIQVVGAVITALATE